MRTTSGSTNELARGIEELVAAHIAGSRQIAAEAVQRAFALGTGSAPRARRERPAATVSKGSPRRTAGELSALAESLYAAVCARPGESLNVLSDEVGVDRTQLTRPMQHLRDAGKVRTIGERDRMRYFPSAAAR